MELVRHALLFLHLLGMASLVGGALVQISARERVINPAMLHGAGTQLVTGVLMVGVVQALEDDVDNVKVAVKAVVALVVMVLVIVGRRTATVSERVFFGVLGLAVVNVAVAVFWR